MTLAAQDEEYTTLTAARDLGYEGSSIKEAEKLLAVNKTSSNSPSDMLRHVLEPLCEETAKLLKPAKLEPTDRLEIALDGTDPDWFVLSAFHRLPSDLWKKEERLSASWGAIGSLYSRIPECERLDQFGGTIRAAATDITACIVQAAWPVEQIEFASENARLVYNKLLLQVTHQALASQQRARFHLNDELPVKPEGWIDNETNPLEGFQTVPAITMLGQEGCGIFMDRGTGKTCTLINRIMNEASEKRKTDPSSVYNVIILCPKNVRLNWQREVIKFATLPGRVSVLRGTLLDRLKLLNEMMEPNGEGKDDHFFSICIINYESAKNTFEAGIGLIPWDMSVLDESHEIKSTYAKIYKTAWDIRDTSEARVCMTGTPITNSLLDLFTQLEFMGRGFSGFNKWQAFKRFYTKFETDWSGHQTLKEFQNLPFLQERLSRLAFMISLKKALPFLPEQSWDICEVSMSLKQKEFYKKMQTRLLQEIDEKVAFSEAHGRRVTADCILTMLLRLSQITSGFVSWDPVINEDGELLQPKKIEFLNPNPKLDMLIQQIKESGKNSKVLVWSCWIPSIQSISARLVKEGIKHGVFYGLTNEKDREKLEKDFNDDPELKVFVGNPAAGGQGINLWGYNPEKPDAHEMNADLAIYYDENWSMVTRSQSEGRNFRRGTRVPIVYRTLICPGTIDQEIYDRVMKKISDANNIQDVREVMKRILTATLFQE